MILLLLDGSPLRLSLMLLIYGLNVLLLVIFYLTQIIAGLLSLCVCGWTCICAYMCAEWEPGHSWGLGFLSEHHLQAFLHLIVKPPLTDSSAPLLSAVSQCRALKHTSCSMIRPSCLSPLTVVYDKIRYNFIYQRGNCYSVAIQRWKSADIQKTKIGSVFTSIN